MTLEVWVRCGCDCLTDRLAIVGPCKHLKRMHPPVQHSSTGVVKERVIHEIVQ